MLHSISKWLQSLTLANWLGIAALAISIFNFIRSLNERRIRVDASFGYFGPDTLITLYNNSTRKITVTYFEIYSSKYYFGKKNFVHTPYSDGDMGKYVISPYESETITFNDQYRISPVWVFGESLYIRIWVSGKPVKTIRLTASLLSQIKTHLAKKFSKNESFF